MGYIKPNDVHSPKNSWTLIDVLEDRGESDTSIALGKWCKENVLAIRWNGGAENELGSPQSRGLPTWFILPKHMFAPILESSEGIPQNKKVMARALLH